MVARPPRPSDHYILIHSDALGDGNLSFKARGILAYLLSRPPGWYASPDAVSDSGPDGLRAVKSGLKELEDAGYLAWITEEGADTARQVVTDVPGSAGLDTPRPVFVPHAVEVDRPKDAPRGWRPSDLALKTARDSIVLLDVELSITKYRIRCAELNREPSNSEWLRWLIADEQKAALDKKVEYEATHRKPSWYSVAGD